MPRRCARTLVAGLLAVASLAGACSAPRPAPPRPAALVATLRGHHHSITSLVLSTDGRRLVSGSRDGTARAWDTARGVEEAVLSPGWWRKAMWTVAISPDGALVASGT